MFYRERSNDYVSNVLNSLKSFKNSFKKPSFKKGLSRFVLALSLLSPVIPETALAPIDKKLDPGIVKVAIIDSIKYNPKLPIYKASIETPGLDQFTGSEGPDTDHGSIVINVFYNKLQKRYKESASSIKLMPINLDSEYFKGTLQGQLSAIKFAVDNGADIISMSVGIMDLATYDNYLKYQEVINYAHRKGVIIIASAGNWGKYTEFYPSLCSNVISVGAVDDKGNYNKQFTCNEGLKFCAPGIEIEMLDPTNGKKIIKSGTSLSTPNVAADFAVLKSKLKKRGLNFTNDQLFDLARSSTGEKWSVEKGWGQIDVPRALSLIDHGFTPKNRDLDPPHIINFKYENDRISFSIADNRKFDDSALSISLSGILAPNYGFFKNNAYAFSLKSPEPSDLIEPNSHFSNQKLFTLNSIKYHKEDNIFISEKITLPDGRYKFNFSGAKDDTGNIMDASREINVDSNPPIDKVSYMVVDSGSSILFSNDLYDEFGVGMKVSVNGKDLEPKEYPLDTENDFMELPKSYNELIKASTLDEGVNFIDITYTDATNTEVKTYKVVKSSGYISSVETLFEQDPITFKNILNKLVRFFEG